MEPPPTGEMKSSRLSTRPILRLDGAAPSIEHTGVRVSANTTTSEHQNCSDACNSATHRLFGGHATAGEIIVEV